MEHLASEKTEWRFVFDEEPPLGKKILMRLQFGGAIIGDWYKESQVVAWAPLPTYTPHQRRYLEGLLAAGYDPTKHKSKQG